MSGLFRALPTVAVLVILLAVLSACGRDDLGALLVRWPF